MNDAIKTSPAGLELITQFEGLRLDSYYCPAGKLTIGVGHVILPSETIPKTITKAQAMELLAKDVQRFEAGVRKNVRVPLTQPQFDALVSFTFNVGEGGLVDTNVARAVNDRRFADVPAALLAWTRARVNGKMEILPGLVRRRAAEGEMFSRLADTPAMVPVAASPKDFIPWTRDALRQAQTALARLGMYRLTVDGLWGPGTAGAVAEFAKRSGISAGASPAIGVPREFLDTLLGPEKR